MKSSLLRIVIPVCLLALALVGFVANIAAGTLSAFGWNDLVMMCPLGALATMIATKTLIPRAVVSIVIAVAFILFLGRAFCGWLCPVPVVSKLRQAFSSKKKPVSACDSVSLDSKNPLTADGVRAGHMVSNGCAACAAACARKRGNRIDVRHFVLVGALVSTLLFGFPVFCLVCPIGLTFGTVFLFANLFMHGDVSWMTAVVPIVLLVEVLAFSKWCHALCPLGALMSLISKGNKTFVPKVNDRACLETSKGTSCGVCAAVCPEGINPRYPEISETAMCECTKCRACVESCPGHAISMPLLAKSAQANEQKGTSV